MICECEEPYKQKAQSAEENKKKGVDEKKKRSCRLTHTQTQTQTRTTKEEKVNRKKFIVNTIYILRYK